MHGAPHLVLETKPAGDGLELSYKWKADVEGFTMPIKIATAKDSWSTIRPTNEWQTIRLSGMTPAARYWTLTLYDPVGRLVANTIERHDFTSEEIVRNLDGSFAINVAPYARPGNWLPTGGIERFVLVWRLYDTPIGVAMRATKEGPMPAIALRSCP